MKLIIIFILSSFIISCSKEIIDYKNDMVELTLKQGTIKLAFYYDDCPKHVENFLNLVNDGFYNETTFHRVEIGYLLQGGDFKSKNNSIYDDGTGDLGYTIPNETKYKHFKGALAMAKKPSTINELNESNACQFYIALDSLHNLDSENYTIFGYVLDGFETIENIERLSLYNGSNPNSNTNKVTAMKARIIHE